MRLVKFMKIITLITVTIILNVEVKLLEKYYFNIFTNEIIFIVCNQTFDDSKVNESFSVVLHF